jgi:hypothetical protein
MNWGVAAISWGLGCSILTQVVDFKEILPVTSQCRSLPINPAALDQHQCRHHVAMIGWRKELED